MTLGLTRNNPGDLLPEHVQWFGLAAAQPDHGPLAFDSMTDGIRAFVKLCYTYQERGLNTPTTFVTNFSPPGDNPTQQYITNVCLWTGYLPNQTLDFHDTPTMINWALAVFKQEQGSNGITPDQITTAIALANHNE